MKQYSDSEAIKHSFEYFEIFMKTAVFPLEHAVLMKRPGGLIM